ncbi:MAG: hypothetical protein ACKO5C_08070 [Ferruginibacter sp.]
MKQLLFFVASLCLVANSFSQTTTTYQNVNIMKTSNGEKSWLFKDISVVWKNKASSIDNISRVFFENYSFTITDPFQFGSEKIVAGEKEITLLSRAVDNMNNDYEVGLVRAKKNEFVFMIYRPNDNSNSICFMIELKDGGGNPNNYKEF